jgi:hypothetical protein
MYGTNPHVKEILSQEGEILFINVNNKIFSLQGERVLIATSRQIHTVASKDRRVAVMKGTRSDAIILTYLRCNYFLLPLYGICKFDLSFMKSVVFVGYKI